MNSLVVRKCFVLPLVNRNVLLTFFKTKAFSGVDLLLDTAQLLSFGVVYTCMFLSLSGLCAGIFSGPSHTSDLRIGTPVATLPGAWRYRVSAGTGRPGVSIL